MAAAAARLAGADIMRTLKLNDRSSGRRQFASDNYAGVCPEAWAALAADRVDLSWATAYETNCAGFHLWRGDVLGGPYARITSTLIPAEGGPTKGASYSYQDYSAAAGQRQSYCRRNRSGLLWLCFEKAREKENGVE